LDFPSALVTWMARLYMRVECSKVDFPQPEGLIKAVTQAPRDVYTSQTLKLL
jgi:hypothetical protein